MCVSGGRGVAVAMEYRNVVTERCQQSDICVCV